MWTTERDNSDRGDTPRLPGYLAFRYNIAVYCTKSYTKRNIID